MTLISLILFSLFTSNIYAQDGAVLRKLAESIEERRNGVEVTLHPDTGLNISQFLEKYNYPLESHEVTTEDGYILILHRIPNGSNQATEGITDGAAKPVVVLVHGVACSSMDWIYLGPNNSLALVLADLGYDVWLINTRGSGPSMGHTTLNNTEAAFWDYSFHEKGYYDLPASIDYILNNTKLEKVTLIGHSEGTSDSMVLASSKTEYNDKINLIVMLSPIAYMANLTSPIPLLAVKYLEVLELLFDALNFHGLPYMSLISDIGTALCNDESDVQIVCASVLEILCGFDFPQLNKTFLTVFFTNTPAGFSIKQFIHYGQEIRSGYFRQYDYGLANLVHYGSLSPPSYDPTQITAPVAAYYAQNDFMAAISNVEQLLAQLPNTVDTYLVEYELFNHLDFILAKDVKTLLYDRVLPVIQKFNPTEN